MQVHVINLDRSRVRLETFIRLNGARADTVRSPAVDGRLLDRAQLVRDGTIADGLNYSAPILGSAMSHIGLWQKVIAEQMPLTIAEDDAGLTVNFRHEASRLMGDLDWDVILWGWNFDAFVWTEIPENVARAQLKFDQEDLRRNIEIFRTSPAHSVLMPLKHAFGIMTYSVTAAGARKLLDACLPIKDELIKFEGYDVAVHNHTLDSAMNKAYPRMKAFFAIPPLAASENDSSTSINLGNSNA